MSNPVVIIEKNIPFLSVLRPHARVRFLAPEDITAEAVRDADALLVRTRTRCDAALLAGSRVSFVGTATIGTDHIDLPWCAAAGIEVANAPGCNAPAVAQYVFSSLMRVINRPLRQYTLGIVGVGHVGSIVARWGRAMEMRTLLCDPPRQLAEGGDGWADLDTICREADIITLHTPLTDTGEYATRHLFDAARMASLRRAPVIINAARGPIVDNEVWVEAIDAGLAGPAIVDCWEGEPHISHELLSRAAIATPHIAGYSRQGKARASQAVLTALCRHFGMPEIKIAETTPPPVPASITPSTALYGYDPVADHNMLVDYPDDFEHLRNNYRLRDELPERFSR